MRKSVRRSMSVVAIASFLLLLGSSVFAQETPELTSEDPTESETAVTEEANSLGLEGLHRSLRGVPSA